MMVFDIKMDFTRKAKMCAREDQIAPPQTMTYVFVVSRENVLIVFKAAVLYDSDIKMFGVRNAYLNTETTEKLYMIAGPELGKDEECTLIITKALYGLKSSGAAYRSFCRDHVGPWILYM